MRVRILDTTLRDGEQSPGVALRPWDKVKIARRLDRLGVDVIEAGFPISSPGEAKGVGLVARAGLRAEICALARTERADVDAVIAAGVRSVHLFIATSDVHLRDKLGITREEALRRAEDSIGYAKSKGLSVEFSAEDASRTDRRFLLSVYAAVQRAGADRVDITDTVGCASPRQIAEMTRDVVSSVSVPVSIHCHDDVGLAVANSIAAVEAGASCVHVAVNGVGERAGNASLEEVAVILDRVALDREYGTGIDLRMIYGTSRLVSKMFRMPIQANKAIVGRNAFRHESGIHTNGIVSNPVTYEWIRPDDVGRSSEFVAGKHAGGAGIRAMLERQGVSPSDEVVRELLAMVKRVGDQGGRVTDADLLAMERRAESEIRTEAVR